MVHQFLIGFPIKNVNKFSTSNMEEIYSTLSSIGTRAHSHKRKAFPLPILPRSKFVSFYLKKIPSTFFVLFSVSDSEMRFNVTRMSPMSIPIDTLVICVLLYDLYSKRNERSYQLILHKF